jgi:hypothetical protein
MAKLAAAFSAELNAAKADVYWDELRDLPDTVFVLVTKRALAEWDKPFALPPIAVLKRYAAHVEGAMGTGQPTALDAWGDLRRKIGRVNLDILGQQPEYEAARLGITPLDSQIVRRLGGWGHLALMTPKDLDFKRREFEAVYDEISERQRTEDQLVGLEPSRPVRSLLVEGE